MGIWDQYCSFCGCPQGYVRRDFIEEVTSGFKDDKWPPEDGKWKNPKGYPVPNKPVRDIVRITVEDDQFWDNCVLVAPLFKPSWVSLPCDGTGDNGQIYVNEIEYSWTARPFLVAHVNCLSILCRRLDITPEEWWLSFYGTDSKYQQVFEFSDWSNNLKPGIRYYNMDGRHGHQYFHYAPERAGKKGKTWWDPADFEDCNWIFASPSKFTCVPDLLPALELADSLSKPSPEIASHKVLFTADLLYAVLDHVVPYVSPDVLAEELALDKHLFNSPTLIQSIRTLLAMMAVSKQIHNLIMPGRQDLFFRMVWQMGYMLPACPLDWKSWNAVNGPLPPLTGVPIEAIPGPYNRDRKTTPSNQKDWRAYMLTYLKLDDRHARGRYRFHRMHIQYARGLDKVLDSGVTLKYWSCGNFGVGTALECPPAYNWEKEEYLREGRVSSRGDLKDPTASDVDPDDLTESEDEDKDEEED